MKSAFGLGKGLNALIPSQPSGGNSGYSIMPLDDGRSVGLIAMIDITKVRPNPWQPRQDFDDQALEDLKKSIKEKGVIQPITVRRAEGGYEIIAGERRVRASQEIGSKEIPAYILDVSTDAEMLELALIENVQRENLNPIEVALGYQRLIEECHLKQEEVAEKVGKDRSTVTNFLRLLRLPKEIQYGLRTKQLSVGHARSLLPLANSDTQSDVYRRILNEGLSVRSTEELVKKIDSGLPTDIELTTPKPPKNPKPISQIPELPISSPEITELVSTIRAIESRLRHIFATQVKIHSKNQTDGSIEIEFFTSEELERLLDLFAIIERQQYK